jgi:hypothetical protein
MDRWVYKLSGAPEETIVRKSTESFLTDRTPVDQWTQFADFNEVKYPNVFQYDK